MTFSRSLLSITALSLLLALALVACGGANGTDTTDEPTSTPRATATPSVASVDTDDAPPPPTPAPDPTATPAPDPLAGPQGSVGLLAPDLAGISSYINTEPFTLEELRGDKVVLIDFWTYTCVNCIRTLPFIKEWHEKYKDAGLVIVGVHAPEFEFEKLEENVKMAVDEWGIEYPVVLDNDHGTWDAFLNRSWPAKYLIDRDGVIRYTHFGEGEYIETEDEIRKVLAELDTDVAGIEHSNIEDADFHLDALVQDPLEGLTRELYAGVERNYGALQYGGSPYVLHEEYYHGLGRVVEYEDTEEEHYNQFIYLQGSWINELENLRHARVTENYEDYILVNFKAAEVNVVLTIGDSDDPYDVRVLVNDEPVKEEQAGLDVQWDDEGNSFITVEEPRMYRVIQLDDFEGHELKLSSNSDQFRVFAYTFGAYVEEQPLP
ncbi:MAG: redoxin domain-containing protein [Dehalococcoidia bacterium]|nr:redoxin domain-containing protein [Dehalococcoidia bacterium]